MENMSTTPIIHHVMTEQMQGHETRVKLYTELEKTLGRPVVSYFTSFVHPVMIDDADAEMIEGLLQQIDLSKGLALLINSPGGIGISAERILNICRNYSGTGEFIAIVPGKAKSAATMVCMGASKILMSKTSELGPIDPQITIMKGDKQMQVALFNLVQSYKDLFQRAVVETGNLQPYLQQLSNYDEREIKEFETAIQLAEDVAVRALESGMMNGKTKDEIHDMIKVFLTPEETKSHGRSIFYEEAKNCGLNIELMDLKSKVWKLSYELFVRTNNYTNNRIAKCVENKNHSFGVNILQ